MVMITFFSAKGSPGTTTTAMMAAALWPRPCVLVDADPHGGDIALRLPRPDGRPLATDRGLLSLLPLARRGLAPEVVLDHCQEALGGQLLLAGLAGPEQATAVGPLWGELANVFGRLPGHDVIVDAGRAHSSAVHLPLLQRAQLVAGVFRPTVAGVVTTRARLAALKDRLLAADGSGPRTGVVCVDDVQHQRDALAAMSQIQADLSWVEAFGQVALDPKAAGLFDGFPISRPERTLLIRSGRRLTDNLARSVGATAPARPTSGSTDAAEAVATDAPGTLPEAGPTPDRLPGVAEPTDGVPTDQVPTDGQPTDTQAETPQTRAGRRRSRGLLRRRSQA